jgi:hypothetical protein
MSINKDQTIILFAACSLVLLTLAFPPLRHSELAQYATSSTLSNTAEASVAWGYLAIIQSSIVLTTLGLFLAFKD